MARGRGLGRGRSTVVHGVSVGMFLAMSPPERAVPDRHEEFYMAWIDYVLYYTEHSQHIHCLLKVIRGSCIILVDCYLCFSRAIYYSLRSFSGTSLLVR